MKFEIIPDKIYVLYEIFDIIDAHFIIADIEETVTHDILYEFFNMNSIEYLKSVNEEFSLSKEQIEKLEKLVSIKLLQYT